MNDINEILEELKGSLEKVDSARKQVDDTVASYKSLKKEIKNYSDLLGDISGNLDSVLNSLDKHKNDTVQKLNQQLNQIQSLSDTAKAGIEETSGEMIVKFKTKLKNELTTLETVDNTLKSELEKLQELENYVLTKIDSLSTFQSSVNDSFTQESSTLDCIKGKLDVLDKTATSLSHRLTSTDGHLDKVKAELEAEIEKTSQSLSNQIVASETRIAQQARINRYIMILTVALFCLAALPVFMKLF